MPELFDLLIKNEREIRFMQNVETTVPEMVRKYQIGNTCYMVKSRSKEQAREDALTKVKRLIRNDIKKRI